MILRPGAIRGGRRGRANDTALPYEERLHGGDEASGRQGLADPMRNPEKVPLPSAKRDFEIARRKRSASWNRDRDHVRTEKPRELRWIHFPQSAYRQVDRGFRAE